MPKHKKKKPQQSSESSTAAGQSQQPSKPQAEQPSKPQAEHTQQPSKPQPEPSVESSGDGGKKGKGKGKGKGSGQQQTQQEPTSRAKEVIQPQKEGREVTKGSAVQRQPEVKPSTWAGKEVAESGTVERLPLAHQKSQPLPTFEVGGGDTGGKAQDKRGMSRTGVPPARPPAQQRVPPTQQHPPPPQQRAPPPQQQAPPTQQRAPPPQQQAPPPQQRAPPPQQQAPPPQQRAPPPSGGDKAVAFPVPIRQSLKQGGTVGKKIVVETNHLALDLTGLRSKLAYHYDVAVDPDRPKRLLRYAVEEFRAKHFSNRYPAFDGRKNLVSASPLPFNDEISDTVTVCDEENPSRNKEFKVTIKRVATVDLTSLRGYMEAASSTIEAPQTAMQMIDIVLRNAPAMSFVPVGRSYFTPPAGRIVSLGDGMDMWYGLYQSVNLGWRPFVNVDVAHKAFPTYQNVINAIKELCEDYLLRWLCYQLARTWPLSRIYKFINFVKNELSAVVVAHKAFPTYQNVINAIKELCEDFRRGEINLQQELNDYQKEEFRKYIKRLKVDYMIPNQPHTKRTYRVNDIAPSSSKLTFSLESGQRISVQEYFRSVKGVNLQYPNMPCLHVGSVNRTNPIYLPAEFCTITQKQVVNRQMNEKQTSNMIKNAATSTSERKRKIMEALGKVGFNQHPAVREFGLRVSETFTQVPARILPPPQLTYREEKNQTPSKGVWRPAEFFKGMKLTNWIILCLDGHTKGDDIMKAVDHLMRAGKGLGMEIKPPQPVKYLKPPVRHPRYPADFKRAKDEIISFFKENKEKVMQLILVIVPDKGESYANVKQTAELNVGVLTQCVKARTVYRMNPATASNILLKVNSKLNGINHKLASSVRPVCLQTPAMLVGADVTHPSPQQTDIPSVAAVCASHDPNGFLYNIEFRLQNAREEIIRDLQTIMKNHLVYFYRKTSYKPRRILFFRDGVSDGQFSQVISAELTAIRRACQSLDAEYKPAITFLVVQKRHHTRFFPTRQEDADGRNCNVPAGTIVDTQITHPRERDFYLVSHASIQGVSRPTKYHCLWDDGKMTDDELQQLTYFLCHMFSRCTRSVSYPAPTYYAHLAAYRARVYIEGRDIQLDNLQHEQDMSQIKDYLTKEFPMFFV